MGKALAAVEKGAAGAFLQTNDAQMVRQAATAMQDMSDDDRETVMSFLSGQQSSDYEPASGGVVGILKQMKDTMEKTNAEAVTEEDASKKSYEELVAAKSKEIDALTAAIEEKTARSGELAVEIVDKKNDLADTEEGLVKDKQFMKDMEKNCKTKQAEWDAICKTRSEEMLALSDTIKILNDDDALDLFKKALPGASSFLQIQVSAASFKKRALKMVRKARDNSSTHRPEFDMILLALRGKKTPFGVIKTKLEKMIGVMHSEGEEDEKKNQYCKDEFSKLAGEKKALSSSMSDQETVIAETKDAIETLISEVEALVAGIQALDKSVAEATEQRKEENQQFTATMASDNAAKEILEFAKNRLNKFYNPSQYQAPKQEGAAVFVQVRMHSDDDEAPPPPPATAAAYSKKSGESSGVIGMIDTLIGELTVEMTEAKTEEKHSQEDYEKDMQDSAEKRAADTKTIDEKEGAKANNEAELQKVKSENKSGFNKLMAADKLIQDLHGECDWLIQNMDVRRKKRAEEIETLKQDIALLEGEE